ncbi:hypothetical protein [Pandoraea sp. B-6]|uniref:hypothetical protein n=1 Tax=Pandoraea sp. B-6 TaxID=1204340 RepID=UPI0012FB308F|nr:hypothetical protein [Pandoraea sp. B-6]
MNNFDVTLSTAPLYDDIRPRRRTSTGTCAMVRAPASLVSPSASSERPQFISDCILYTDRTESTVELTGSRPSRPTQGLYKVLQDRATQIPQLASNLNQSALATDAMNTNTAQYRIGLRIDRKWIVYQACAVSDRCY